MTSHTHTSRDLCPSCRLPDGPLFPPLDADPADLRAITIRQPWAWAVAIGAKTIENRSRLSTYRGPLAIHAGINWSTRGQCDPRIVALADRMADAEAGRPLTDQIGAIIAVADLVDVHPDAGCCRPWGESSYVEGDGKVRTSVVHYVLERTVRLAEPVQYTGALGLWRVRRTAYTAPVYAAAAALRKDTASA